MACAGPDSRVVHLGRIATWAQVRVARVQMDQRGTSQVAEARQRDALAAAHEAERAVLQAGETVGRSESVQEMSKAVDTAANRIQAARRAKADDATIGRFEVQLRDLRDKEAKQRKRIIGEAARRATGAAKQGDLALAVVQRKRVETLSKSGQRVIAYSQLLGHGVQLPDLESVYIEAAAWIDNPHSFRMEIRPTVSPSLAELLDRFWHPDNPRGGPTTVIGSGSTPDAVSNELSHGPTPARDKRGLPFLAWHGQKSVEQIRVFTKWLKQNPDALPSDRRAAVELILDARNGLPFANNQIGSP
jgi:hypothetical protein